MNILVIDGWLNGLIIEKGCPSRQDQDRVTRNKKDDPFHWLDGRGFLVDKKKDDLRETK